MLKTFLGSALAAGLLFAATPAAAQLGDDGPCTREVLKNVADGYIKAQESGDPSSIPLGGWTAYNQNMETASMLTGVLGTGMKVDFSRSLYDVQSCATFTEVIITDPKHPYVLGTVMSVRGGRVNTIDLIATDAGDWLFNAADTLKYSKAEKWDPIPENQRMSREAIIAAADAYLNSFSDKSVQVPWGTPCARLEGGMYTGKGAPGESTAQDSCNVGVPSGVKLTDRRYIVDPELGAVAVVLKFGDKARPDIHTFRVENGKIRYVHTITVCNEPNCGFPQNGGTPPAQAGARPAAAAAPARRQ